MRRAFLIGLTAAPLLGCSSVQNATDAAPLAALSVTEPVSVPKGGRKPRPTKGALQEAGRYFVEFRSRHALSYGHTFLVHGRLDEKGEIGELTARNVAGFHPAGKGPELWSVGHVVPVPAETGPSDGDLEEQYVSARFRVYLSEGEYNRFHAQLRAKQANGTLWHAALYNCNKWVGEMAEFVGVKAPSNHLLFPADYINQIRRLNTPEGIASR